MRTAALFNVDFNRLILSQVSLPKDCGGSSFCRVTKRILGPNVLFRIVAHMPELDSIDITAGFRDIRITDTVSFSRLELLINVSMCSEIHRSNLSW